MIVIMDDALKASVWLAKRHKSNKRIIFSLSI